MNDDSLRPETNTRHTKKCSVCRQRRKKCVPHDRDWENSQQKCEFCETHDLACGPNVRYNEDPAVIRRRSGSNQTRERDLDGSAVWSAPDLHAPSARTTRGPTRGLNEAPPNVGAVDDGGEPLSTPSMENLEEKALSKLHEFHALGSALAYVSQPAFVYCHAHGAHEPHHDLSMEEKLHDLFINIYGVAVEAGTRNESHLARWILFALVSALDRYKLFDKRKRHILLKIALMFQELGHRWDCEHVLLRIAGWFQIAPLPSQEDPFPQEDPFHLLAKSFPTSSMSIRRVLVDRWNETVGGNHVDPNLNVPPLHAVVQHRNPTILSLLSDPKGCDSMPPASSLTTSSNVGQVRANMDERDLNSRTALFTAVANEDKACCFILLWNGANANTRDDHGHTALEVAVRRGCYEIAESLIKYNADVNPDITNCSSLPLHAAIESGNFQLKIIQLLLNSGAQVDLRRYTDNKHAIDIANDKGYHELAKIMRGMITSQNNTPFMTRDPFLG